MLNLKKIHNKIVKEKIHVMWEQWMKKLELSKTVKNSETSCKNSLARCLITQETSHHNITISA